MGALFCRPSQSGRTPLGAAAFDGNLDRASKLLTIDTDVNELCDDGWSPVALASQQGHLELVKLFLTKGADPNSGARPALVAACYAGSVEVIKYLLDQKCSVNALGEDRWSAITLACQEGHLEVIQILMENGADPNLGVQTALVSAALKGNMDIVRKLMEHGCDINALGDNKVSAVAAASQLGHTEMVTLFMTSGANPDLGVRTALSAASCTGKMDIVQHIIDKGHNVNALGDDRWSALSVACENGHEEIVNLLLSKGAKPDLGRQTALVSASLKGNLEIVKEILKHECNLNAISDNQSTAIAVASQCGHLDIVKLLLSNGANPNHGARPALVAASHGGKLSVVQHLITCGNDVNIVGKDGWSALTLACQEGHHDIVRLLLANGAKPETGRQTALVAASLRGRMPIIKDLIKHGANVNALGVDSWSAIASASKHGRQDIVDYLLSHKADPLIGIRTALATAAFNNHQGIVRSLLSQNGVKKEHYVNAVGGDGWSALSLATGSGHLDMVKLLLDSGAKPDVGRQPALVSAALKGDISLIKDLLNHGADVNALNKDKLSPLGAASAGGYIEIVKLLLSNGAKSDIGHETALVAACLEGRKDIINILLEHGCDVNALGINKTSAIVGASLKGHMDIVKLLIGKGADPNIGKDTALAVAALEGHFDIVKFLLDNGGKVNTLGLSKMSPLALASHNGHLDIVQYLLERDADPDLGTMTALGMAAAAGQRQIVELLVEHNADIDGVDDSGGTALVYAYRGGHQDVIHSLLELDADPDIGQWTPLVESATGGHLEIVQDLINEEGYDVNDLDGDGDSAICGAVFGGHLHVVKFLLEVGADPTLGANKTHFNEEGDTALGLARRMGHKEIEEYLLENGVTE